MPVIADGEGALVVDADELARQNTVADDRWSDFWSGLTWRPIGQYDRAAGRAELLRDGDRWALGFWGALSIAFPDDEQPVDPAPAWRDAQESMDEARLEFDPTEFAEVTDDWRAALIED